jgi:hypothetical protein
MLSLKKYLDSKNQLSSIVMIRLAYNGSYQDYTKWRVSSENIFLFNDNLEINYILWLEDKVSIIDDTKILIETNHNIKENLGLELFYGGFNNE